MHGPKPLSVGGVNDHWAKRRQSAKKFSHIHSVAGIGRIVLLLVQVVIKRNQGRVGQGSMTLRDHTMSITPVSQLVMGTQLSNCGLESPHTVFVVFQHDD